MADTITAVQAYQYIKTGIKSMVDAAEELIRAKKVSPMPKSKLDGKNGEAYAAFVKKYKIAVVDAPVRGQGSGGKVVVAGQLAGEGSKLQKLAEKIKELETELIKELEPFKRDYMRGFIRGSGTPRKEKEAA
jgi:hypothetical protein